MYYSSVFGRPIVATRHETRGVPAPPFLDAPLLRFGSESFERDAVAET